MSLVSANNLIGVEYFQPPKEEEPFIEANRSFLGKSWSWFKKYAAAPLLITLAALPVIAVVGTVVIAAAKVAPFFLAGLALSCHMIACSALYH